MPSENTATPDYWQHGEPCLHPGCANHIAAPCQGCHRRGAQGRALKKDSTVFVDELFTGVETDRQAMRVGSRHGHRWCHMWSEDLDALHDMAVKIRMRREWFQDKPGFPHYDLIPAKRARAIRFGAVAVSLREYLQQKRGRREGLTTKT